MANVTLSHEVRDVLERSTTTEKSVKLPPGQLDRKLYENVAKVLKHAGGKWTGGLTQAFIFQHDPRAKLGLTLETGVSVDDQKKFQAFYTPPELAAQVAELAQVSGHIVLEPSAGQGALVKECYALGAAGVDCVELNPDNKLTLELLAMKDGERRGRVTIDDFLTGDPVEKSLHRQNKRYDRIVMNPPFTRDQDIVHVEHALKWLAPGGILVAIMLDNMGRSKFQALTGRLDEQDISYSFVKVPEKTFKDTPVRTIILKVKLPVAEVESSEPPTIDELDDPKSPLNQAFPIESSPSSPPPGERIEVSGQPARAQESTKPTNQSSQMKLRIKRADLSAALAAIKSAASAKASLPILANVCLKADNNSLTLTATNLDLTLRAKVEAVVEDAGERITVPCVLLHDIVRSVKGDEVFLHLQRKTLHVACGTSQFKLSTIDAEEFPGFPRIKDGVEIELEQFQLRRLLAHTAFAQAVGGERPVLNGALFKVNKTGLTVAGCDGHRIAVDSIALKGGRDAVTIIPAAATANLLRLLAANAPAVPEAKEGQEPPPTPEAATVAVSIGSNAVQFDITFGSSVTLVTLVTKIIEGKFPDYHKVIPPCADGDGVKIGRTDLLNAVNLVELVGTACRLEFRKQTLTIMSDNPKKDAPGEAVESLLIPACADATVKLEARFLMEALAAVYADEIEFHVTANGPAVLKTGNWLTVIAAMKDKTEKAEEKSAKK